MDDVVVKRNARVFTAIIDSDTVVGENATVGTENVGKDNIIVIAKGSEIAPGETVRN